MKKFDDTFRKKGFNLIAGIDEVGRGSLAGPLVVAAVIFDSNYENEEINDSKKLSSSKRNILFNEIIKNALSYSIIFIDEKDVDLLNVKNATRMGMKKALESLTIKPNIVLIDYEQIDTNLFQQSFIKGDEKSFSIAAASILAKVSRDNFMIKISKKYPQYDFQNNVEDIFY